MYDCTADILAHRSRVAGRISRIISALIERSAKHDLSKLSEPEKSIFDKIKPEMRKVEREFGYGSPQWQEQYDRVSVALRHHYSVNDHHPEHFPNGVNGMSLVSLLEMLADWKSAAEENGHEINFEHVCERFGIEPQLKSILAATLKELEW